VVRRGYISATSARDEEEREKQRESEIPLRGWESVLNTCFPYHIHFEPQSAVALMPAWLSSLYTLVLYSRVAESPGGAGRVEGRWFISFFNNSLLFSSSLSIAATFDLLLSTCRRFIFIYDPTPAGDEIHRLFHCSLPADVLLSSPWSVQLFVILFLVEIIAGTSRQRSVCAEHESSRALDKELSGKAIGWWVQQREDTGIRAWQ